MAQSGYTPILIYASGTTGNTPSASNLTSSTSGAELALNYYDGKLFYKDNTGTVQVIASKASNSGSFTTLSGSTSTTTPIVQSSGSLLLNTNGTTTAVTIDTNQNVGIGVTPSSWGSGYRALDISSVGAVVSGSGFYNLYNNLYNNGSGLIYKTTGYATFYSQRQDSGQHQWYVAASGTAGASASVTQAMTLNNSGTLVFGVSGQGIQFTNGSATVNSTLNDYETGTWTPSCTNSGLTSYTSGGKYTKIGNIVYLTGYISITSAGTASGQMAVSNLPFSYYTGSGNIQATGVCRESGTTGLEYYLNSQGNQTTFFINSATNGGVVWLNTYTYSFSITYPTTF